MSGLISSDDFQHMLVMNIWLVILQFIILYSLLIIIYVVLPFIATVYVHVSRLVNFMQSKYFIPVFIVLMGFFSSPALADLENGQDAPEFRLQDQYSNYHSLSGYTGKWIVLYFYPKDDTPGCTTEACNFRDDIFHIRSLGAEVLGISVDTVDSHAKFSEKHGLPFPLLSDVGGKVAGQYGALWSLGPVKIARRHSFIINPAGKIARIYRKVEPEIHSNEIISDLDILQKNYVSP